ncbi:threonine/serine ThrE exporter family protein [Propionicicella superfundia]|uniref:threonine/serine ThrE exporter family protein n=1 Tax=Propionicicella superfundia TaxID=348582 RepID=UPI000490834D|nr:threonine/serine exporter family protein [Propionicicella superfundia]
MKHAGEHEHEHEDALEPRHLIRRSDVVLRSGILMLGAGTSGLRVREVMRAVAATVGLRRIRAEVTFTDITLTVRRRNTFRTQVEEINAPGVNAHRIALLKDFAHSLPERATVAEVDAMLDRIERTPRLYPAWLLIPLVALACASITILTNGGWREVVAVLPASALAYGVHRALSSRQLNHLAVVLTSAALATGLYVGLTRLLDLAMGDSSARMSAGLICAAIFLIPGFPLVTAGLDLTRIDLMAGIPRLTYAAMVLLAMTIGVWIVITVAGASPDPVPALTGNPVLIWLALLLASFFAVFGWAMMFNTPFWMAVASGVIGLIGNVPRLLLLDAGVKMHVATFVGCFLMGLLCAVVAKLFDMEKIIMTVPTLLVSIPGSAALRTLIYFDQADVVAATGNGVTTVLAVIAMVAGLAGARMLTDPEWAFTRSDPPGTALHFLGRLFRRPE